jgi:translation initiation factor 4A
MAEYRSSSSNHAGRYTPGGGDARSNRDGYRERERERGDGEYHRGGDRGDRGDGYHRRERGGGGGGDGDYHRSGSRYPRGGSSGRYGGHGRREHESSYNIEEKMREGQVQEFEREQQEQHKQDAGAGATEESKPVLTPEEIQRRDEYMTPIETFDDLGKELDLKIIRGVMAYGFETPSLIQQKAIRPILGGYDVIAQAQSGMGKTATFCIGALGRIDMSQNEIQTIVLAHTLELAMQIEFVFKNIGRYLDVRVGMAVKSIPVRDNIDQLLGRNSNDQVPHVVIGTPGRVLDMLHKEVILGKHIKLLVLDEADELLSDGFLKQIKSIIGSLNSNVQIGLFSATMEPEFFRVTRNFMRNPLNILIKKEALTLEGIKQFYIDCEKNEYKFETLCDLYSLISVSQTIIYCNHYQCVDQLTRKLQENNFKVSCIHGNMDIAAREEAMKKFRSMESRVLISTDLLGRGIDVQQVSVVINYDLPLKIESYIHRIGRSGRHGRKGTAINLINASDSRRVKEIEQYYNTLVEPLPGDVASILG